MPDNWWFISSKAFVLALTLNTSLVFFFLPPCTPTLTQASGVGEVLVVKIESLAPPLCLLGDDSTPPFETIHINVGPTSDNSSGNNSLLSISWLYQGRMCVLVHMCVCVGVARGRQQDKEEKVGRINGR